MEKQQTLESSRRKLVDHAETVLLRRWHNLKVAVQNDAPNWDDLGADQKAALPRHELASASRAEGLAIERIRRSLERIKLGTYGKCVICRGEVETERLRAIPDVERCGGCTH